ncbi:Hypothetical_protein [Hexamita inflata]|uniref:Hypothetical_protein n=1 Tax=Hexamita inflata TaxID=28002 RepID=A0AA86UGN9_9EUKA|nr:Hypothetical protein HINF_LOCUS38057 [Hexamita inflata]
MFIRINLRLFFEAAAYSQFFQTGKSIMNQESSPDGINNALLKRASNPKILDLLSNCYEHLLTYPQDITQVPEQFEFPTTFIPLKEMLTLAQVGSTYRLQ